MMKLLRNLLPAVLRTTRCWRGTLVTLAGVAGLAGTAQAQVAAYQFAASQSTYTQLPATATRLAVIEVDDAISGAVPVGFTFLLDGVPYTNAYVSSNGFLSFNSAAVDDTNNGFATASASAQPLLAPLWDDLSGFGGAAAYQTSGTAPNRVFTMEWRNWKWDLGATAPVVSFQVKLYETTNQIEFIYRPEAGSPNMPSASIGIAGTGTPADFLSLSSTTASPTANSLSETTTLTTVPAAGQRYAFTLPPASNCAAPRNLTQTTASTTTARVSWTAISGGGTFSINYGLPGFTPGTGGQTTTSSTNAITLTGLTPGTQYQYYVTQVCTSGSSGRSVAGTFRTACATPLYASLPFNETFENTWIDRCDTREVPGNNWRNSPSTGELSWRRDDDGTAANWAFPNAGAYSPAGTGGSSHSARFHSSSNTAGQVGTLDLYVDLSAAGSKRLLFSTANLDGTDTLAVQVSVDGGTTFGPALLKLTNASGNQVTGFQTNSLSLTSTSATTVIRFRGTADYGYSDIGLDNVRVEALNGCLSPVALTTTGATTTSAIVAWSGAATGSYTVFYGLVGFTPGGTGSQQLTGITGLSTTITGLTQSTTYEFYVRQDCGSTASLVTGPSTFRTACPTPLYAAVPFSETFENAWIGRCDTREVPSANWRNLPLTGDGAWRRDDDGTAANWTDPNDGAYSPSGANNSSHSARFHSRGTPTAHAGNFDLFVNLSSGNVHELSFDYVNKSVRLGPRNPLMPGTDSLTVQLSTDGGQTFGPQLLQLRLAEDWESKAVQLVSNSATSVIRFRATTQGTGVEFSDVGLDNVTISNCPRVQNVVVSDTTGTTATITFTPVAGITAYTLVATPATGPAVTITAPGSPAVLNGLQSLTAYTVSVTSSCAAGQNSVPVTTTLTTLAPLTPPANDEPCAPTQLTLGAAAVAATTLGATTTAPTGYTNPGCAPAPSPTDVWFFFVAPTTTGTTITVTGNPAGQVRVFAAGTCNGPFTQVACRASTGLNTAASPLTLSGLAPGAVYYVSVSGYGATTATGPFTISLNTILSTGVGQLPQGQVQLYPNPSHDGTLTLQMQDTGPVKQVQAELFNALGQRVRTQVISVRGGTIEQALPVQGLVKGFYTLRLQVGDAMLTRKVVIE